MEIIDLQFGGTVESILEDLAKDPPEIIGLSAKVLTFDQMMEILDKRKAHTSFATKGTLFVAGNIVASHAYKEIISRHADVLVAIGEAEEACADLVRYVAGHKTLKDLSNTAYWDQETGRIVVNPARKSVDFADLPLPDRENAALSLARGGEVYAELSRGCSWGACRFCSMWVAQHKEWRRKPVEKLIAELNALQAMGAKRFALTDSDFLGPNPSTVEDLRPYQEFARQKIASGNTMSFFAYIRVQSVYCETDSDAVREEKIKTLRMLRNTGLQSLHMGVDAGSTAQARRLNKGTSRKEAVEAVRILKEVGIERIKVGLVIFDPFMSFDELVEGMNFVREAGLKDLVHFPFARLTLYEGTPITCRARAEGLLETEKDIALSFGTTAFLDQRVGRLSRIFDAWHRENKPLIFAIQEIRREWKADEATLEKLQEVIRQLREAYYLFLDALVKACADGGTACVEATVVEHLLKRAAILGPIVEITAPWRDEPISRRLHDLAAEGCHSDILFARILGDSSSGDYLKWDVYRGLIIRDGRLPAEMSEAVIQKTLLRVQEQVSWRNARLRIPAPETARIRQEVATRLAQTATESAILIGADRGSVLDYLRTVAAMDQGVKLLWSLGRRLSAVQAFVDARVFEAIGLERALEYLLLLSWQIECGNDDLLFVDRYPGCTVGDIDGLKRAVAFCYGELDVNERIPILARKLLLTVQNGQFDIRSMPRIDAETTTATSQKRFDENGQLTARGLAAPEIGELTVDLEVFDPTQYYQMTGLLVREIPDGNGNEDVLDVGTGTGVLGLTCLLRGARRAVLVDTSSKACACALRNLEGYGVAAKADVRLVPTQAAGRFFEVLRPGERFNLIVANPPWGEGAMADQLGRAFSDPGQTFLRYLLTEAPGHLKDGGDILLGYSSRNDYGEKTLLDVIGSLKGLVDYDWQVVSSIEFTRPLYSEIFYALRLRPVRPFAAEMKKASVGRVRYEALQGREQVWQKDTCWSLTRRCVLDCGPCYNKPFLAFKSELPFESALAIVDFLRGKAVEQLDLSGGEPLLWPRALDLIAYARARGMKVQLFTSGAPFVGSEGQSKTDYLEKVLSAISSLVFSIDVYHGRSFEQRFPQAGPYLMAMERILFETAEAGWQRVRINTCLGRPHDGEAEGLDEADIGNMIRRVQAKDLSIRWRILPIQANNGMDAVQKAFRPHRWEYEHRLHALNATFPDIEKTFLDDFAEGKDIVAILPGGTVSRMRATGAEDLGKFVPQEAPRLSRGN